MLRLGFGLRFRRVLGAHQEEIAADTEQQEKEVRQHRCLVAAGNSFEPSGQDGRKDTGQTSCQILNSGQLCRRSTRKDGRAQGPIISGGETEAAEREDRKEERYMVGIGGSTDELCRGDKK